MLFVDLDRFKVVNDSLGHAAGDTLLVERGRPAAVVPAAPPTPRPGFGGDEFAVLLHDIADVEQATAIARSHHRPRCSAPFLISGKEIFINASIGIAFGDRGGTGRDRR